MDLFELLEDISVGEEYAEFVLSPVRNGKPVKDKEVTVFVKVTPKQVSIKVNGKYISKGTVIPRVNVPYNKLIELHNKYVKEYNSNLKEGQLKRSEIVSLSQENKNHIRGRWNDPSGKFCTLEAWEQLFEKIKKSYYLMHEKNSGWFKGLKWFVRPENFSKLVAGDYDDENMRWFIDREEREAQERAEQEELKRKQDKKNQPDEMDDLERDLWEQLKRRRKKDEDENEKD